MPLPAAAALAAKFGPSLLSGLGSFFGGRSKRKGAEAQARNQNKMNQWRHKFDKSGWEAEKQPYYRGRDRSRSMRNQLVAALMKNPKYGLDKLFPGFANFSQQWTGGQPAGTDLTPRQNTINPHAAAGPPPELEAAAGGNTLTDLAGGAAAGVGTYLRQNPPGTGE